jgi:cytochrome c oxidase subunit II
MQQGKSHSSIAFAVLLGVVLLVAACASGTGRVPASPGVPTSQPPTTNPAPSSSPPSVKEFTIVARQFAFEPNVIRVKQGDTVKITASSADVAHGFAIPAYGVDLQLSDATPKTATFVADKKGTFPFICNVPCGPGHQEMTGTLIVE